MHGKTPPDINYADFSDGQTVLAQAEPTQGTDSTAPAKTSCSHPSECEVLTLTLESTHPDDAVKASKSLTDPHGAPETGVGRFRVIPKSGVTIKWTVKNGAQVDHALLELFAKGNPNAIWSHDFAQGISDAGELPWDTKVTHGQADYPDDLVNMDKSPYKMKLTIRAKEGAVCTKPRGYTYFDVDFEHRYKAVKYIPTTGMGRFGIEFDPKENEIKVAAKTFFAMLVAESNAFKKTLEQYKADYITRCTTMWNQRFALKDGNNKAWPVSVYFQDGGSTTLEAALDARVIEKCPADVIKKFEDSGSDHYVALLSGIGGSGLPTAISHRAANVFLYEVAFDAVHPPNVSASIVNGHQKFIAADWQQFWTARVGNTATNQADRMGGLPKCTVKFARGSDDLNPETKALLSDISTSLTTRCKGLEFRVFVKGQRAPGELANLEIGRATRVYELLAPDPHICRRTVAELGTAPPEYAQNAADAPEVEGAIVEIRYVGGDVPYSAATHECGHFFGLPDEYQTYGPGNLPQFAQAQVSMQAQCGALRLEASPTPYERNNHLMSVGTLFFERYYLTFLEALRKVLGAWDEDEPNNWTIVANATPAAPPAGAFSPDFSPLEQAVLEARAKAMAGESDLATLETLMRTKAVQAGGERVVYAKILDRDNLSHILDARPTWDVGDKLYFSLGVQKGRELLHCVTFLQPQQVEPVIEIPNASSETGNDTTVFLRYLDVERRERILLRATQPYQGNGTFTCNTPGIEFYATESGGAPLNTVATGMALTSAELWAGKTLYAAGELAGATLTLALAAAGGQRVSTAPAQRMLRYKATPGPWMQFYNFSVDRAEAPAPVDGEERRNAVFVPLCTADNPAHLRLRAQVKICLPMGYTQKMILRVSDGLVAMFKHKTDASGDAKGSKKSRNGKKWREYELRPTDQKNEHFPDKRSMDIWLEGIVETGGQAANNDHAEIELISTTFNRDTPTTTFDTCKLRVGACPSLTVEIPATAPLTARNLPGTTTPNVPAPQRFCAQEVATILDADSPYKCRDFDRNPPVVIVKGSLRSDTPLRLKARYGMGMRAQFYLEQAADDHATLKAANTHRIDSPLSKSRQSIDVSRPTESNVPIDVEIDVPTDNVGSFHIIMRVSGSTCYIINLVVVEALALAGPEVPTVANLPAKRTAVTTQKFVNGLALVVRTGNIPFPAASTEFASLQTQACAVLAGRVHIKGGGPDFKRGVVGRVLAGWIQNKTGGRISGRYRDGAVVPTGVVRMTGDFVSNQADGINVPVDTGEGMPAADRYFGDAQPAMQSIAISTASPLLDTGNDPVGGAKTCLGQRYFEWDSNVICDAVAVAVDSPGTEFLVTHFTNKNALLTRAEYAQSFKSYLCVWTDATGRGLGGNDGGPGDLLYAAVAEVGWGFDAAWDITWPDDIKDLARDPRNATGNWQSRATVVEDVTKPLNATITTPYTRYPAAVPAQGLVETRPPAPIRIFAWNAKTV